MAVTLTKEFYINFGLFLFACLALGLSIWAFATPCKKDGFGSCNIIGPIHQIKTKGQLNKLCKSTNCANPALYWCGDSNDCSGWGINPPHGGAYYIFGYNEGPTSPGAFQQMCPASL